ncbi:MAG: hypothetical protein IJU64_01680 [Bacilli bacterium]|nr:hypothetical protein [Bacilli bacterium]
MLIRNRLISFFVRVGFLLVLLAVAVPYLVVRESWAYFLEFETGLGLVYLVVLALMILFNVIDLRHGIHGIPAGFYMPIKLPLVAFLFFGNFFYFVYGLPTGYSSSSLTSILFHAFFLAVPTLEWLFFDIKGTVRPRVAFMAMLYPVFYVIIIGFRTLIWPNALLPNGAMYPYPFLKPGWDLFILWAILAYAVLYLTVLLYIFLNNLLAGRYRRQDIDPF